MDFGKWNDEEVKSLFKFVEVKKGEGVPLIEIFKQYAQSTKRHQNSVRNYYYKEVQEMQKNKLRANALNINLNQHKAKSIIPFSTEDTKNLVEKINELVGNGYSVRRACLTLADGDVGEMIRYQNKYRLETKYKKVENMGSVIKMPIGHSGISDEEINALLIGIIKIVKKQEFERAKKNFGQELDSSNKRLKDALAKIVAQNEQIIDLKLQIRAIEQSSDNLLLKQMDKRIKKIDTSKRSAKNAIGMFVNNKKKNASVSINQ